jgi:hypothetical protein
MRLGIMVLDPATTLNNLKYLPAATFSPGDTGEMWMQLVDLDSPVGTNAFTRFMPAAGATLTVSFFSNSDANAFTKTAVQPLPVDPSIWKISLLAGDTTIMAGCNIGLRLVQGAIVTNAIVRNVVSVNPQSAFQC